MEDFMLNYAEVLEGYLIADEGLIDGINKVGKAIGGALLAAVAFIRKIIASIANKVRTLISRKNKGEKPEDIIARLKKDNDRLAQQVKIYSEMAHNNAVRAGQIDRDAHYRSVAAAKEFGKISDKKERATKLIVELKKKIAANEEKIQSLEKQKSESNKIAQFEKTAYQFLTHCNSQMVKAYSVLPKLISDAKSKNVRIDSDEGDNVYERIQAELPTMASGSWSYLAASLTRTYLPLVEENSAYITFNGDLGRAYEVFIKQANNTIDHLEKIAKENQDYGDNKFYKMIIRSLTKEEGFIPMLKRSANIANRILNCYTKHNEFITHTVYDAL